jgi:hypothetical protein
MRYMLLVAVAALLTGCGGGPTTSLSDERFIDIVVELRKAAAEHRDDPDAYVARKDEILGAAGVDEAMIREYVEVRGGDLRHMAVIWSAVNERLTEEPEIE